MLVVLQKRLKNELENAFVLFMNSLFIKWVASKVNEPLTSYPLHPAPHWQELHWATAAHFACIQE